MTTLPNNTLVLTDPSGVCRGHYADLQSLARHLGWVITDVGKFPKTKDGATVTPGMRVKNGTQVAIVSAVGGRYVLILLDRGLPMVWADASELSRTTAPTPKLLNPGGTDAPAGSGTAVGDKPAGVSPTPTVVDEIRLSL